MMKSEIQNGHKKCVCDETLRKQDKMSYFQYDEIGKHKMIT